MAADALAGLIAELPEGMVVTDPSITEGYRQDRAFDPSAGKPLAVVRPQRTEEVQAVLRWATANNVPVVTRNQGIASTLFIKEQRSDLFQLERALGIRIEKMRADGIPAAEPRDRNRGNIARNDATPRSRLVQLPGEVLQVQMQS